MSFRLFHFGLSMFLAATASTGEPALIGGVGTTLALSVALHNLVVVEGIFFFLHTHVSACDLAKLTYPPHAVPSHTLWYHSVTHI